MGNPLQDRRAVADWASLKQVIEIAEKISTFDGLATIVDADLSALDEERVPSAWRESRVTGVLQFDYVDAENRVPALTGEISATIDVVCQRCLEPFKLRLDVEPKLLLLESEQSDAGFDEYDVWELEEQKLRPQDVVEELLVMAMPFSAMHANMAECSALSSDKKTEPGEQTTRPFAALRERMAKDN